MKQYEAAAKFLELVKTHPDDFHAVHDTGRDHSVYSIKNLYRAVSINIDTQGGFFKVVQAGTGSSIMYAEDAVLEELYNWSIGYIAQSKVNDRIGKDNASLRILEEFYSQEKQN